MHRSSIILKLPLLTHICVSKSVIFWGGKGPLFFTLAKSLLLNLIRHLVKAKWFKNKENSFQVLKQILDSKIIAVIHHIFPKMRPNLKVSPSVIFQDAHKSYPKTQLLSTSSALCVAKDVLCVYYCVFNTSVATHKECIKL